MHPGHVLLATATCAFLGLQVILFNGYHHDAGQMVKQVEETTALSTRLDEAVGEYNNLKMAFGHLEHQLLELSNSSGAADVIEASSEFPPGNEDMPCVGGPADGLEIVAAVVTIAFNRPAYLKRHMESVLEVHQRSPANRRKFPLHISQDGSHEETKEVARGFLPRVRYLSHYELAAPIPRQRKENIAYYRIANHYKFIFQTFFDCFNFPRIIILEDDMQLAVDFFSFFEASAPLLSSDPSLYCVSSWNDHGQDRFVSDPLRLYRSDFFPGLGWMMGRGTWDGFKDSWPDSYWDDWIRLNSTRKGRQCIRPEVCRNFNFGEKGSSKGFFYRRFLKPIRLNDQDIDWMQQDLSYLSPDRYLAEFEHTLSEAQVVEDVNAAMAAHGTVKLLYDSQEHYETLTQALSMLREWKDGVPRGGYRGVVTIHSNEATILIAPSDLFVPPPSTQPKDDPPSKVDATGALVRSGDKPVKTSRREQRWAEERPRPDPTMSPRSNNPQETIDGNPDNAIITLSGMQPEVSSPPE
ncbi:hypothetical protein WJX84_008202 [Apatococcus fuscideae]|uniref:Alpha-1,3-mannosyl-glycoprotein 2-beta-N-acetylglucosaminyltransferase n=1 Tax=Apatococcus fuscideae TaxID=2026836 RepID=A0AAW1TG12_9CHLO